MEIFGGHDVGGGHRPVGGDLDVLLLEDGLAFEVLNDGVAQLPDDLIVRGDAGAGEMTIEDEAREGKERGGGALDGYGAGSGSGWGWSW